MYNFFQKLFLLLLTVLFLSEKGAGKELLIIKDDVDKYNLGQYLFHYSDVSNQIPLNDLSQNTKGYFKPIKNIPPNFVYSNAAHWFKFTYANYSKNQNPLYLEIENPFLDLIEVYISKGDGSYRHYKTGDQLPFDSRPVNHSNFVFKLPPNQYETTVFLKIKAETSVLVPATLYKEDKFFQTSMISHIGLGIYYGAILVMFFYNLVLFINLKDRNYLFYILYLLAYAFSLLSFDGLSFQFLFPDNPEWANKQLFFWISTANFFGILFTINFLNLKKNNPLGYKILWYAQIPVALTIISSIFYNNIYFNDLITANLSAILALYGIYLGWHTWQRKRYSPAKFYLFAWGFMLSGIVIYVFKDYALIPSNFLTEYSMHLGSGAEMVLLSLGLADRINVLKKNNEDAQKKIINNLTTLQNIKNNINKELEKKVNERVKEIATQNEILETKKREILNSISYAKKIQEGIFPPEEKLSSLLNDYFIYFKPKDLIGGDFYWFDQIEEQLVIGVADCTGHGVPGALMSMLGISFLNEIVSDKAIIQPNRILGSLRNRVIETLHQKGMDESNSQGMDIALCTIDLKNNILQFSGANNSLYLIRKEEYQSDFFSIPGETQLKNVPYNNTVLKVIKANRQPIGFQGKKLMPFWNYTINIVPGDNFYMFTDGYVDQFGGPEGKKFMTRRLQDLLVRINNESMKVQKEIIDQTIREWMKDEEQVDDILIIGFKT